jgi:hypothetical protein
VYYVLYIVGSVDDRVRSTPLILAAIEGQYSACKAAYCRLIAGHAGEAGRQVHFNGKI